MNPVQHLVLGDLHPLRAVLRPKKSENECCFENYDLALSRVVKNHQR